MDAVAGLENFIIIYHCFPPERIVS